MWKQYKLAIIVVLMASSNLLAYTSPIKSDEVVVFFPTIGFPIVGTDSWQLNIHGWIYEPEWGGSISQPIRNLLGLEKQESFFNDRIKTFFCR